MGLAWLNPAIPWGWGNIERENFYDIYIYINKKLVFIYTFSCFFMHFFLFFSRQGRYFVALSLEEAEHLRGTLHGSQFLNERKEGLRSEISKDLILKQQHIYIYNHNKVVEVFRRPTLRGTACAAVGCQQIVALR